MAIGDLNLPAWVNPSPPQKTASTILARPAASPSVAKPNGSDAIKALIAVDLSLDKLSKQVTDANTAMANTLGPDPNEFMDSKKFAENKRKPTDLSSLPADSLQKLGAQSPEALEKFKQAVEAYNQSLDVSPERKKQKKSRKAAKSMKKTNPLT